MTLQSQTKPREKARASRKKASNDKQSTLSAEFVYDSDNQNEDHSPPLSKRSPEVPRRHSQTIIAKEPGAETKFSSKQEATPFSKSKEAKYSSTIQVPTRGNGVPLEGDSGSVYATSSKRSKEDDQDSDSNSPDIDQNKFTNDPAKLLKQREARGKKQLLHTKASIARRSTKNREPVPKDGEIPIAPVISGQMLDSSIERSSRAGSSSAESSDEGLAESYQAQRRYSRYAGTGYGSSIIELWLRH